MTKESETVGRKVKCCRKGEGTSFSEKAERGKRALFTAKATRGFRASSADEPSGKKMLHVMLDAIVAKGAELVDIHGS